ncbi:hypothetical protein C0989_001078 [Termitomyces sp. Mn162]|nr:hypothetical protein C0989_001078 [Termitomyces sp. Mn162]
MGSVGKWIVLGSGKASGVQGNSGGTSTAAEKVLKLIKEPLESAEEVSELPKVGAEGPVRVVGGGSGPLGAYVGGGSSIVVGGNGPRFSLQVWYGPQGGLPIPTGSRVTQADVTPEYFAEAVGQARGPLTLKWCQVVAPCVSCTRQGEQCKFEEPVLGVRRDTSVCLPCRSQHERCSVTLSWRATCIAAEQGWDREWVAMQLEEGQRGRVSGRGSGVEGGVGAGWPLMKIGPLQGGWREGAPTMHDKGKWRVSPSPEAGPSKQAQGEPAMAGPPGPTVYFLTSGALVEQSAGGLWSVAEPFLQCWAEELERLLATCGEEVCRVGEERDGLRRELDKAWKEWDLTCRDKDIAVGTAMERLSQLQEL